MPTSPAAPAGQRASRRPVSERRAVTELLLDEQNYRYAEEPSDKRQQALLALLLEEHQLEVVGESLAENGYFEQEPLVTVEGPEAGKFTVVEGNRRLAALRLLTDADARSHLSPSQRTTWDRLSAEAVHRGIAFTDVPTVRYPDRAPVQSFLGNRHIAGIKKWDALSKARFLSELIDRRGGPTDFAVVANEIGSERDTVRDTYLAFRAYLQARDAFKIDTRGISKAFSVFFRTFQYAAIRGFVGADAVFEARDGPEEL
ncbi:Uknown, partial [mine drainage metagenome]